MCYVEKSDRVANGAMLGKDRLILNRHLPATKVNETGTERSVGLM
jgi:hypothetical protein